MHKREFLDMLRAELSGLPQEDAEEHLEFYSEMIDDRIEEGNTEEEAVAAIGSVRDVAAQIMADTPSRKDKAGKNRRTRRLKAWEIVLLAVGSPVWVCLLIAAFAVILSVYIVLWSAILSIWAVFVSLGASALGCVGMGVGLICGGNALTGIAMIGVGLVCAGLAIFLFFGCMAATKGTLLLTKTIVLWLKKYLTKKEEVS